MSIKTPNFFILGAPKCGTTSMYYWLNQHSQVYFPEIKETHFFSSDLHPKKRVVETMNEYSKLYEAAQEQHLVMGDASVFYLYSKEAVKNILDYNSESKFLVLLRNPMEMVVSLHAQYLHTGNEIFKDFEKAWGMKEERVKNVGISKITEDPQLLDYGKVCSLGNQVERLLRQVEKEKVMFILLEELKNDPHIMVNNLLSFLGVEREQLDLGIKNEVTARKSLVLHRFIKHLNQIKKSFGIGKLNTGFGRVSSALNTKKGTKFVLQGELKKEITEFFAPDIRLLSSLIDKDLDHWMK